MPQTPSKLNAAHVFPVDRNLGMLAFALPHEGSPARVEQDNFERIKPTQTTASEDGGGSANPRLP